MQREPFTLDFVGVGAARSGTSWLARCLGEHPDIFVPRAKELHFFDNDTVFDPSLAPLLPHFADASDGQRLGEFTPRYVISRAALERIEAAFPRVKILLCLRDPVERAWSQFCYFRFNLRKEPSTDFEDSMTGFFREDYLVKSLYHPQLVRLFEIFPRDRVHVVLFDRIRSGPQELMREIYDFLGVDPGYEPEATRRTVNASRPEKQAPPTMIARAVRRLTYSSGTFSRAVRKFAPGSIEWLGRSFGTDGASGDSVSLDDDVRSRLFLRHFAADLEQTERLLGVDLSSWKHPAGPA